MGSWLSRNITDTQIIPLYLTIDIDNSLKGVSLDCSAEDVACLALNFVIQLHTTFVQVFGRSLYHQQVGQILLWRDFMWVPYTISRKAAAYFRRCPPPSVAFLARCECPVLASHCSKQELFFLPHLHHSLTQSSHGKFSPLDMSGQIYIPIGQKMNHSTQTSLLFEEEENYVSPNLISYIFLSP